MRGTVKGPTFPCEEYRTPRGRQRFQREVHGIDRATWWSTTHPTQAQAINEAHMIDKRSLGTGGPQVGALGYGAMVLEGYYGVSDDVEAVDTIHRALDAGMTMIASAAPRARPCLDSGGELDGGSQ